MESKTKNKKSLEQIKAMVARAFDGGSLASGEDAVCELVDGFFNAVYQVKLSDGRDVILKIAPPKDAEILSYEKNMMHTEVTVMQLVRQNPNIPVPVVYFYDPSGEVCDSDYFFMQYIPGVNLHHMRSVLSAEAQTEIELKIGALVRQINEFTGPYFGYDGNSDLRSYRWRDAFIKIVDSLLEDGSRKNVDYDYSYESIREAILKHSSSLDEVTTPRLVHWDAWDSNFFIEDGQIIGLIDFERAIWADPLMEAQFRQIRHKGISNSMRGYGKTSFTDAEEERCQLYSLHLGLVMRTECAYRNYDSDFIYTVSQQLMGTTMTWLKEN